MFQWAQSTFDKLAQTVAPPPEDGVGRFVYCVQRGDEDAAMGCIAAMDPIYTVVNVPKGQYPIHLACQYSCQRLLLLLMNQPGINIQQPDLAGNTPLHYASTSTAPDALPFVKLLITQFNASVLAKNSKGQTPYDVATLNAIRQHLLPIQLQAETQIALDNGGQGLPPGIDLGGLRITNPAIAPPPTFGGAPPGGGLVGDPQFLSQPQITGPPTPTAASPAPPRVPASSMFGTPSPSDRHTSAPDVSTDPQLNAAPYSGNASRAVSSSAVVVTPAPSSGKHEYSRVGSSSAALGGKYRADGFHSSSSDVSLQRKYGHANTSQYRTVAPPPSSGNASVTASITTIASTPDGPNPFSALGGGGAGGGTNRYSALNSRGRYVAYGQVAAPTPATPTIHTGNYGGAPSSGNLNTFTPGVVLPTAPASFGGLAAAPMASPPSSSVVVAPPTGGSINTFMPPPPYHSHNYVPSQIAAQIADANAQEIFAHPSPLKEAQPTVESADPAVEATSETTIDPAPAASSLPENWSEALDPTSGHVYYYNSVTQETSWEYPGTPLPNDWVETTDPTSGQIYYYNSVTQETSWERPTAWDSSTVSPEPGGTSVVPAPLSASDAFGVPAPTVETTSVFGTSGLAAPNGFTPTATPAITSAQVFGSGTSVSSAAETGGNSTATPAIATSTTTFQDKGPFAGSPRRSLSADELFAEDGPDDGEPLDTTIATTDAKSHVFVPTKRSLSADELFSDNAPEPWEMAAPNTTAANAEPTVATPPKGTWIADNAHNGGEIPSTTNAESPFAVPPRERTLSADEIFADNPPDAVDEGTPPPTPEAAPVDDDSHLEEIPFSDVPLSPTPVMPKAERTEEPVVPTTMPAVDDSLFAAIGMPPPPFSSRKR